MRFVLMHDMEHMKWKNKSVDNEGDFEKNNLNFVKEVWITYVNVIVIVITVSEKK